MTAEGPAGVRSVGALAFDGDALLSAAGRSLRRWRLDPAGAAALVLDRDLEVEPGPDPVVALAAAAGRVFGAAGARILSFSQSVPRAAFELSHAATHLVLRGTTLFAAGDAAVSVLSVEGDAVALSRTLPLDAGATLDFDVDVDARRLVVVKSGPRVVLLDAETGARLGGFERSSTDVRELCVRFAHGGAHVYLALNRGSDLRRVKPETGRATGKNELSTPSAWCTPLAASADGRHLAAGQSGEDVALFDAAASQPVAYAELWDRSPAERLAASVVRVRHFREGDPGELRPDGSSPVPAMEGNIRALALSPDGRFAALGTASDEIVLFDRDTARIERGAAARVAVQPPLCLRRLDLRDHTIAPDGGQLLILGKTGRLQELDLAIGEVRSTVKLALGDLKGSLAVRRAAGLLLVSGPERRVVAFDERTGKRLWEETLAFYLTPGPGGLYGLAQTGPNEATIHRFDPATRRSEAVGTLAATAAVGALGGPMLTGSGAHLVVRTQRDDGYGGALVEPSGRVVADLGTMRYWSFSASGRFMTTWEDGDPTVHDLSAPGSTRSPRPADAKLRLGDFLFDEEHERLVGFHPSTCRLCVIGMDGRTIGTLAAHRGRPHRQWFGPRGDTLFVLDIDGNGRLWSVSDLPGPALRAVKGV